MKSFVCFFIIALVSVVLSIPATTPQEKLEEYSEECKATSGISEETLAKVRNHEDVDDPKLKDHGLCIMKKAEFMDDAGELLPDKIKEKLSNVFPNKVCFSRLVNFCAVKKDTPQDTAVNFIQCIHGQKGKHDHDR